MANDESVRQLVALYGLKVECLMCGAEGRHRPETQGRLRARRCPRCGRRSLRTSYWVRRHPGAASKLVAEHRAGEAVFSPRGLDCSR